MRIRYSLLILIVFSSLTAAFSQDNFVERIYISSEFQLGTHFGLNGNFVYRLNNQYSLQAGVLLVHKRAAQRPDDYLSGLFEHLTLGSTGAFDSLTSYYLQLGRYIPLGRSDKIRLNLSAGLALTTINTSVNFVRRDTFLFSTNYTWDNVDSNTMSIILNPRVEFLLTEYFGLQVSPLAVINNQSSYYGLGIGFVVGNLIFR
jgi:hypothetical protein